MYGVSAILAPCANVVAYYLEAAKYEARTVVSGIR